MVRAYIEQDKWIPDSDTQEIWASNLLRGIAHGRILKHHVDQLKVWESVLKLLSSLEWPPRIPP